MPSTDAPTWWADVQQEREDLVGAGRRPAEDWLGEEIEFVPRSRRASAADGSGAGHPLHGVFVALTDDAFPVRPIEVPEPAPVPHRGSRDAFASPPPAAGVRRTVHITGHPGEHRLAGLTARRHRPRTTSDRIGARPDRIMLWAVLLGAILIVLAATSASSHAAVGSPSGAPAPAPIAHVAPAPSA